MIHIASIGELRARLSTADQIGLVPTMGYLHAGHQSLIATAARENPEVVVTLFVNPLQFAPGEDLAAYPRDLEGDAAKAEAAGATILFAPTVAEMYPRPVLTTVLVAEVSARMEGASRPTHFAGVATVVAKLFAIAGPCRAYFGEKDFQQVAVVRRMAADLSMPVEVVACPTVREPDGLALSSRNVYLSAAERETAPILHRALVAGAGLIAGGETDAEVVRGEMAALIDSAPLATRDYVEVADPDSLEPLQRCDDRARLFGAVQFGRARLIDNVGVPTRAAGTGGPTGDPA